MSAITTGPSLRRRAYQLTFGCAGVGDELPLATGSFLSSPLQTLGEAARRSPSCGRQIVDTVGREELRILPIRIKLTDRDPDCSPGGSASEMQCRAPVVGRTLPAVVDRNSEAVTDSSEPGIDRFSTGRSRPHKGDAMKMQLLAAGMIAGTMAMLASPLGAR